MYIIETIESVHAGSKHGRFCKVQVTQLTIGYVHILKRQRHLYLRLLEFTVTHEYRKLYLSKLHPCMSSVKRF